MNQQTCKSVRFCSVQRDTVPASLSLVSCSYTWPWLAITNHSILQRVSFGIELPVARTRTILALVVRSNWRGSKPPSDWPIWTDSTLSLATRTPAWLLIGCDRAVEYKCNNVLSNLRCSPSLATQEKRSGGSWPGQRWRAVLRCQEKNVDHYGDGDYMWPLLAFLHHTPGHGVQRSSDLEMKLRSTLSIIRHT